MPIPEKAISCLLPHLKRSNREYTAKSGRRESIKLPARIETLSSSRGKTSFSQLLGERIYYYK